MFIKETISRLRGAGAIGEIVLRADSGFYLHDVVAACRATDVRFSITARMIGQLRTVIEQIPEHAWSPIDYFLPGAGVAEITWTPFDRGPQGRLRAERGEIAPVRLIVRRTPPTEALAKNRGQDPLFPVFDYHPLITDRAGDMLDLEADHRRHAEVELSGALNYPGHNHPVGVRRARRLTDDWVSQKCWSQRAGRNRSTIRRQRCVPSRPFSESTGERDSPLERHPEDLLP